MRNTDTPDAAPVFYLEDLYVYLEDLYLGQRLPDRLGSQPIAS